MHNSIVDRKLVKDVQKQGVKDELDAIEKTFKAFEKFYKYCIDTNTVSFCYAQNEDRIPVFKAIYSWEKNGSVELLAWLRQKDRSLIVLPILCYLRKYRSDENIQQEDTLFFRRVLRSYINNRFSISKLSLSEILTEINESRCLSDLTCMLPYNSLNDEQFVYGDLLKMELNPYIKMNLDILVPENPTVDAIKNRYDNIKYLVSLGNQKECASHVEASNLYRVLRVFNNWGGKIEHQYNMTWDYYGRYINNIEEIQEDWQYMVKYRTIYSSKSFRQLIDTPQKSLIQAMRNMILEYLDNHSDILDISDSSYATDRYMKAWVYAKLLCLDYKSELLSLYRDYPFGCSTKGSAPNKINPNAAFSLVNSVAKKFWKGGYSYVNKEYYRIVNFDSPLFTADDFTYEEWADEENQKSLSPEKLELLMEQLKEKHAKFISELKAYNQKK